MEQLQRSLLRNSNLRWKIVRALILKVSTGLDIFHHVIASLFQASEFEINRLLIDAALADGFLSENDDRERINSQGIRSKATQVVTHQLWCIR